MRNDEELSIRLEIVKTMKLLLNMPGEIETVELINYFIRLLQPMVQDPQIAESKSAVHGEAVG